MMGKIVKLTAALFALSLAGTAAGESYSVVWQCELEDEKTIEDVQAVNSKWLAWVRENISADINSSVVTAVIGDLENFIFVDSYPDLATWANAASRLDSEEADEIDDLFDEVSTCSENTLYKIDPTE